MDVGTSAHAAALWVGLNIFLLLVLSLLVVRQRRRHNVAFGDEGVPELAQAIRAFANATEYVPAGMIAVVMMAVVGALPLAIHISGFLLFVGRVVNAFGLTQSVSTSIPRAVGIVITWVAYVFAGAHLLFYAIM